MIPFTHVTGEKMYSHVVRATGQVKVKVPECVRL